VVPSGPFTYLALGDSTGVGVGARTGGGYAERLFHRLLAVRPAARLVNLCQNGATSADVLASQLPEVKPARPSIVTLGIGINDLTWQIAEEAFSVNLEEIAVGLGALRVPVVLMNIPDLALAPIAARLDRPLYERHIEVFNEHVEATAARHHFTLVDLYANSRRLHGRADLFSADGFHPSAEGYEEWADQLWPAVEPLLGEVAAARP